jgi:hypothetical protein
MSVLADELNGRRTRQVCCHVRLVHAVCRQRKVTRFTDLPEIIHFSDGHKRACCGDRPEQSIGIYLLEPTNYSCTCLHAAVLCTRARKIWVLYCAHKPSGRLLTRGP